VDVPLEDKILEWRQEAQTVSILVLVDVPLEDKFVPEEELGE